MRCAECTELLSAYMDEELTRDEQQEVHEHLAFEGLRLMWERANPS